MYWRVPFSTEKVQVSGGSCAVAPQRAHAMGRGSAVEPPLSMSPGRLVTW